MTGIGTTAEDEVHHVVAAEVRRAVGEAPILLQLPPPSSLSWAYALLMLVVAVVAYDLLRCTVVQWWKHHHRQENKMKTDATVVEGWIDNDAVGFNDDSGVENNNNIDDDVFFPCSDFDEDAPPSQPAAAVAAAVSATLPPASTTPAAGSGGFASLSPSNNTRHVADNRNVATANNLSRCTRAQVAKKQPATPSVSEAARSLGKRKQASSATTDDASLESNGVAFKRQRVASPPAKPKPAAAAMTPSSSPRTYHAAPKTAQAAKHAVAAVAVKRMTLKQAKGRPMNNGTWHQKYALLKAYHRKHKHCLVPKIDQELGWWVSNQRRAFSRNEIPQERKLLLDKIGFVWHAHDAQWEDRFQYLVQYKEQYGDCLVPHSYTHTSWGKLGAWVKSQRYLFKRKKMSMDRIQRLDAIGFVWAVKKMT